MTLFNDYKRYHKEFHLEEPLDFFIFRPLAYVIVKLCETFPITPNQITFCAFIVAMLSSYSISQGTPQSFLWGGVGIFVFSVLDCCDGMLARVKKNGSQYGDLIDMFVDLISGSSYYVALYFAYKEESGYVGGMALLSGVMLFLHASLFNYYKKQFLFYLQGDPQGRSKEIQKYREDLEKLKQRKGHHFKKTLLTLFLSFARLQKSEEQTPVYDVKMYRDKNIKTLPMWGLIAGSSHFFLLSLALMFNSLEIYLFASIIFFNVWMIFAFVTQLSVNSHVLLSSKR